MKEPIWVEIFKERVTPVPSNGNCDLHGVTCPFKGKDCTVPFEEDFVVACVAHTTTDHMFITEDQLPAYLAARLLEGT